MLTHCSVEAPVGEAQTLDRDATHDVRFDDLFYIGFGNKSIPDCVRVDDDVRSVFALVQASGLVCAHSAFESALGQPLLEHLLQFSFGVRIAAAARMASRALVPTDEDVFLEVWH